MRSIPRGPRTRTRQNPAGLTPRELEVLDLLCDGFRNAEIAQRLVVSEKTVDHHVSAILRKLGAQTRPGQRQGGRAGAREPIWLAPRQRSGHRPARDQRNPDLANRSHCGTRSPSASRSQPCRSAGVATANRSDRVSSRRASANSVPLARRSSHSDSANEGPVLQGTNRRRPRLWSALFCSATKVAMSEATS